MSDMLDSDKVASIKLLDGDLEFVVGKRYCNKRIDSIRLTDYENVLKIDLDILGKTGRVEEVTYYYKGKYLAKGV